MHDFDATVRRHRDKVRAIARYRSFNGAIDAEEVEQEIWLRVWMLWDRLKDLPQDLGGLIWHIGQQIATWQWQRATRQKRTGKMVPLEDWSGGSVPANQDERLALEETLRAIDKLKPVQRTALLMQAEGHTPTEIGKAVGFTRQRASQVLAAGLRKLEQAGV